MQPRFPIPLFLFCWLQCALFIGPVGTIMSDAILSTSVNVVEKGSLEVDPHAAIDLMLKDGKTYAGFGPGMWMVGVPYYFVLRPIVSGLPKAEEDVAINRYSFKAPKFLPAKVVYLQAFMVWLFMAPLTAFFFAKLYQYLARLSRERWKAVCVTLAVSTGTLVAAYSCVYSKQWLATLLISLTVLLHLGATPPSMRTSVVAGLLGGASVAVDYIAVFGVALATLFVWFRASDKRSTIPFLAGLAAAGLALAAFHTWFLGNPLRTPYQYRVWYDNPMGFTYKGVQYNMRAMMDKTSVIGLGILPSPAALVGLTFGTFKGLFFLSPVLLFGIWGHIRWLREAAMKPVAVFSLALFVVYFWMVASLNGEPYWSCWPPFFGPRYLIYGLPFLAVGIAALDLKGPWRWVFFLSLAVSIANNLLALMFQDRNLVAAPEAPSVQAPIHAFAGWLTGEGARIPLLDQQVFAASAWTQGIVFVAFLAALAGVLVWGARGGSAVADPGRPR